MELTDRPRQPRFPWAPVDALLDSGLGEIVVNGTVVGPTDARKGDQIGVHYTQIARWRRDDVTAKQADRIASALDLHMLIIWPEMELHPERAAAAARKRKQYRERREEILERNRRYAAECADAIAVQRRARYVQNAESERAKSRAYYEANRERMKEAQRVRRQAQKDAAGEPGVRGPSTRAA